MVRHTCGMSDPTVRALRLLDLLQSHRRWSGRELARRLGVSARTLRRDVERLRELGYVVESAPGEEGGYQLAAGSSMPPLLLDDDEAVALAVGLRTAAVAGHGAEPAARTMAKLDAVLPPHLRRRAAALADHVVEVAPGPRADAAALGELALACRDRERVRFAYTDKSGNATARHAEPHSLVARAGRWYLLCHDIDRDDWRTFRIDRLEKVRRTGARFPPRELTDQQVEQFFGRNDPPRRSAVVTIAVPVEQVRAEFGHWAAAAEATSIAGQPATRWPIEGWGPEDILGTVIWIPTAWPWSIECDAEVAQRIAALRDRLSAVVVEQNAQ